MTLKLSVAIFLAVCAATRSTLCEPSHTGRVASLGVNAKAVGTIAELPGLQSAAKAEQAGDWDAALLLYENAYDATATTPGERVALRRKFLALRPKVKPNTDPAKAGLWKIKVYVFRTVDITRTVEGKEQQIKNTYTDAQIKALDIAMAAFASNVWAHTLGSLRIVWETVVIEKPLTHLAGWPDPADCGPYFTDLKAGDCDCVMVYANAEGIEPWDCWGGTLGCIPEAKGAMYIGFNDNNDGITRDPSGEVQLHEWLHVVHMTVDDLQGYPAGLMVTSDCGGDCGGTNVLKCWEGKEGEGAPGWMPWYYHALDCHLTRKMWRELSVVRPAENVWIHHFCREALVLGPFTSGGETNGYGLTTRFIEEESVKPALGAKEGGHEWQIIHARGRTLDSLHVPDNHVVYVAIDVRSPRAFEAQARIGSDDCCKLWQDGKLLLTEPALRSPTPDSNIVPVHLKRGSNLFLMKVCEAGGGWGAIFRISDKEGRPVPGIQYDLPSSETAVKGGAAEQRGAGSGTLCKSLGSR